MTVKSLPSIDFETRSSVNIRDGLDRYVSCPEFEVLMCAIQFPDMPRPEVWHRGWDLSCPEGGREELDRLFAHIRDGGRVLAWNAMFEWMVWDRVCVPKYGWPELPIEQLVDSMAQAAAHNLPQSLGRCAEALGIEEQKNTRGRYLIQRLCCPHPPTKTRAGKWVEDPELFAELVEYCRQDVVTERGVARKLRPLTEQQQRMWIMTQRINGRGVPVDLDECRNILAVVEAEKERLNRELRTLTGRRVTAASKRDELLAWVNERMPAAAAPVDIEDPVETDEDLPGHEEALPDMKGATVEAALARTDLPADVRRALEIRRAVVQTSTAKFAKMLKVAADDGTLKGMYVWHGAGTGRWASRGGINTQNFARPPFDKYNTEIAHDVLGRGDHAGAIAMWGDEVMDGAVSCLRGVIKAPPGYELIDADYSNVEVRVAALLAGQHDLLEAFRGGLDPYKMFATELFRVRYEEVTGLQRQFSKAPILGGIFGLGKVGLQGYAIQYGVEMTLEESATATKLLRSKWSRIPATWYACGDASIEAVRNPGHWFPAGDKLSLICHKNFLWLRLPSGRMLAWSRPKVELKESPWMEKYLAGYDEHGEEIIEERPAMRHVVTVESIETKTRLYRRHPLIGSSIFQSGVQGAASDILGEGLLNVEAAGYSVRMLTHDELTAVVPAGTGSVEEFGRLMCLPAPWREDLPLAFEGYRSARFRK